MKNKKSQSGVVLIVVLIAIAILTTVVVDLVYFTHVDAQIAANSKDDIQTSYIARSGVNVVAGTLKNRSLEDLDSVVSLYTGDDLNAKGRWAITVPNFPVGQGVVTIRVIDERSKINLNTLVNQNSNRIDLQVKEQLAELFDQLGIESSKYDRFISSLINWLDRDLEGSQNNQDPSGADGGFYLSEENSYAIKDGPLDSLEEIRLIDGMDTEFYEEVKDYLTVYPVDKRINFSTAPKVVLLAALQAATVSAVEGQGSFADIELNDDIAQRIADEIISERDNEPIITRNEITQIIQNIDPTLRINSGIAGVSVSSGTSDTFYVNATGILGADNPTKKIVDAVIRKQGSGNNSGVKIISWKEN
ncbi:MAG TPA: type II secretion system minor pseudopilin GspK [Thermodesulfobacteriota bacterium]|nr:type II secretion system minor pseudopilin GspK [Thermodesulfobacteriota bacterium]